MSSDTIRQLNSIRPENFANDFERFEAKEAARGLLARLETPVEHAWALMAEQPFAIAGLILVKDLGIWARWAALEKNGAPGASRSLEEVLSMSNAQVEPNLILFILEEVDVDTWKPTPFSLAMGGDIGKMVQASLDHTYLSSANLPKFLAKIGYAEPLDLDRFDNYTDTFGDPFWARCKENPDLAPSFAAMMTALTAYKMDWTAVYDTNRLASGADLSPGAPALFVDVAGLHGMDSMRLLARHPSLPSGLLFVQDLPEVVDFQIQADKQAAIEGTPRLDARITRMPHDFYNPQPLLGARTYFFHSILHDWPDSNCVRILENIKGAMKKGYSKLLIYDVIMPLKEATTLACAVDMYLMVLDSGIERTEAHWREIIESVGLKVVRIDRHEGAVESMIEVELS
ncbi:S-adenosyl-L-methionine-dependent methyltransferase [Durotheca rogersii]|uniref:S-adenosyl-L-methionine-dependent methyltransferase n=1 Tax=Durotheca rogersii TaxID=419775 RepID=UPI00221EBE30|nr:S-adenosyl-L-methionine-dependent methyltransferase [Durotheca rogersii]KAI5865852.1 S-adenosyl-L-methionine-dependent methyltransferase [Durotheca rogersii]